MKHIQEEVFYKLLDNALSEVEKKKISKHLSECEHCRREFKHAYSFMRVMDDFWIEWRKRCPNLETLIEYRLNTLDSKELKKIEVHLDSCPFCCVILEETEPETRKGLILSQSGSEVKGWISTDWQHLKTIAGNFIRESYKTEAEYFEKVWEAMHEILMGWQGQDIEELNLSLKSRRVKMALSLSSLSPLDLVSPQIITVLWAVIRATEAVKDLKASQVLKYVDKFGNVVELPKSTQKRLGAYLLTKVFHLD